MATYVKCKYCGVNFDRDKIAYVEPNLRRYAHADCYLREFAKNPKMPKLEIKDPNDIVVCCYCKKKLNKKIDKYQQIGNKFAHQECFELENKREKTDREKLEEYICKLFKVDFVPPRIAKQINGYIKDYNYSYSGIQKTLIYFYELKNGNIKDAHNGIGIVPYIYQDAHDYYYNLWIAQESNKNKDVFKYVPEVIEEITIPSPKRETEIKNLFSFIEEDNI